MCKHFSVLMRSWALGPVPPKHPESLACWAESKRMLTSVASNPKLEPKALGDARG